LLAPENLKVRSDGRSAAGLRGRLWHNRENLAASGANRGDAIPADGFEDAGRLTVQVTQGKAEPSAPGVTIAGASDQLVSRCSSVRP
jgi:hypothetical protein